MKEYLVAYCVVLAALVMASAAWAAQTIEVVIEDTLGPEWTIEEAYLSSDQSMVGIKSLYMS